MTERDTRGTPLWLTLVVASFSVVAAVASPLVAAWVAGKEATATVNAELVATRRDEERTQLHALQKTIKPLVDASLEAANCQRLTASGCISSFAAVSNARERTRAAGLGLNSSSVRTRLDEFLTSTEFVPDRTSSAWARGVPPSSVGRSTKSPAGSSTDLQRAIDEELRQL